MRPVFVVEGKSDVQRLENLIDADFVICNGSAIDKETLEYIRILTEMRDVIVLTDPDFPGEKIRKTIQDYAPKVKHAFVDRSKASNGKKLGVAECQIEELKNAIANYVSFEKKEELITARDFIEIGLSGNDDSSKLREKVAKNFNLGYGNAKTIRKRLNMLGITIDDVRRVLDDCE